MKDPDLRPGRRAGCAALIQGCRVQERSWNAPSSLFYSARVPWPVVGGLTGGVRNVGDDLAHP